MWKIPRTAEQLGRLLLLILILLGPWLNGGSDPLPLALMLLLSAAIAGCLCVDAWQARHTYWLSWVAVLAGGGFLLGCLHLVPVWSTAPDAWAPAAVKLKASLTGNGRDDRSLQSEQVLVPDPADSDLPTRMALTLDPHATRHTLVMILMGLVVLVGAQWWLKGFEHLYLLARCLSINGALLTVFAVLAKATWNGKLYWVIPLGFGRGVFGPLVYHNQAGSILLMTSAAALACIAGLSKKMLPERNAILFATGQWKWPSASTLGLWFVLGLNIAGLLLTLSRGALLAAVIASILAFIWARPRQGWQGIALPIGLAVACALGLIVWFRASDAVSQRYSTLMRSEKLLEDIRLDHWQDGMRAGSVYGLTGVGMGAYRHIHLLFQDAEIERTFLRAHNQYLETWVDSGLMGILLLVSILASVLVALRWLASRRDPMMRAAALLGILVFVGQLVHAVVDFCLYLPATAVIFAAIVGALLGVVWQGKLVRGERVRSVGFPVRGTVIRGITALGFILNLWAVMWGLRWASEESAVYAAPWNLANQDIEPEVVRAAIEQLEAKVEGTDDWRVPLALGELYLVDFRWRLLHELQQELTLQQQNQLEFEEVWQFTDPLVLHARAHALYAEGKQTQIDEEIRSRPLIRQQLAAAHNQFRFARRLCPFVGQVHLRLGELDFVREQPNYEDETDLLRVVQISVGNPDMLFEAGRRLATAGRDEAALDAWKKSLSLSSRHWNEIYALVGIRLSPTEMLDKVLPEDPKLLLAIAGKQFTEQEQGKHREKYLQRVDQLLGQSMPTNRLQLAQWHLSRTELELLRKQYGPALEHLSAAVRLRPEDHALRAQYAKLLAVEQRLAEALQEVNYCLGLQPNNWDYRNLHDAIEKQSREARQAEKDES